MLTGQHRMRSAAVTKTCRAGLRWKETLTAQNVLSCSEVGLFKCRHKNLSLFAVVLVSLCLLLCRYLTTGNLTVCLRDRCHLSPLEMLSLRAGLMIFFWALLGLFALPGTQNWTLKGIATCRPSVQVLFNPSFCTFFLSKGLRGIMLFMHRNSQAAQNTVHALF